MGDVVEEFEGLIRFFYQQGFLYDTALSYSALQDPAAFQLRPNGTGWNVTLPFVLSGINAIEVVTLQLTARLT